VSENCTLAALQRRRIEAAEMKLLRPLAGYTLCYHKTNDYIESIDFEKLQDEQ